jgi:DNA-binding MarR family transcriptional regulator
MPTELRTLLTLTLQITSLRVIQEVERALEDDGGDLTWREYVLLRAVASASGQSQQALAERSGLDRTTISQSLEILEEMQMVRRAPHPGDRRRIQCLLGVEGRAALDRADRAVSAAEARALRRLDARQRRRLQELLARAVPPRRSLFGGY